MISICIPVYNFNVSQLLYELELQSKNINSQIEIILIDDCSSEEFKIINESSCKKHTYIELKKNIGRAKIRNLFLKYAQFENLLFIDCDSLIVSKEFLSAYLFAIENENIICGGTVYTQLRPAKNKILRWKYGMKKESQSFVARNLKPNKSFMTNNFLIGKKILANIKFDERLNDYGHEDTLFGFELKKKNINIKHIENPVMHNHIEDNAEYLQKTEKAIINLISILKYVDFDKDFISDVALLHFYENINPKKITGIIHFFFICFKPLIKFLLIKGYVFLWLFDFYKLGFFIQTLKKQTTQNIYLTY